jgi:polysaccharide pyruvyl transferase WcaK-like protein
MDRRKFTELMALAGIAISWQGCSANSEGQGEAVEAPTFLIISGWQTVNIGDIAHTPGLLVLLREWYPRAKFYLWPKSVEGYGVPEMLKANFPNLTILPGTAGKTEIVLTPQLQKVFEEADMLIHGSGPSVMGWEKLQRWQEKTNKPFGIMGTTVQSVWPELKSVLEKSSFTLVRETRSLEVLKEAGLPTENTGFFPDATFNIQLSDSSAAEQFLQENELEEKAFICIVPRLRYSPYHKIHDYIQWSEEKIQEVTEHNDKYKEADHAKLREVMTRWVEATGKKVLVCPEMTYQVDIMDELLIDPLPEEIRQNVVKHPYWITDKAASVYQKAFAVVSMECHSPIIAMANQTPGFYIRQKEDTIKGQMYYDLKLNDWVFEMDETHGAEIYERLDQLWQNPDLAQKKIATAFQIVDQQNKEAAKWIQKTLSQT